MTSPKHSPTCVHHWKLPYNQRRCWGTCRQCFRRRTFGYLRTLAKCTECGKAYPAWMVRTFSCDGRWISACVHCEVVCAAA
jgi:hypothetical protein